MERDREATVYFDGVCNLCNAFVRFVVARDPSRRFEFAPLQGTTARERLQDMTLPQADAIVLVEGPRVSTGSTAALRVAKLLPWPYPLLYGLLVVPRPIRDSVYAWVARNRYRWWGKVEECPVPEAPDRQRFLD